MVIEATMTALAATSHHIDIGCYEDGSRLVLPRDACTQTFGFVARKGAGKTYAAGKLVEGLLDMGVPVVILDPVGVWWGLRLRADGKTPGYKLLVAGGLHGDIPLEPGSGARIARFVSEQRVSLVLDTSLLRKGQRVAFITDFAEELFHLAAEIRKPITVVFEEAQKAAPQRSQGALEARMLGAVEDIVRLGRNYGMGAILITQRPQSVNKEVLNQVECLFAGQLVGIHERRAVEEWIEHREAEGLNLVKTLPSFAVGHMIAFSPQWLKICKPIQIGKKTTFDASATPDFDAEQVAPPRPSGGSWSALISAFQEAVAARVSDQKAKTRGRGVVSVDVSAGSSIDLQPIYRQRDELLAALSTTEAQLERAQSALGRILRDLTASIRYSQMHVRALERVKAFVEESMATPLEPSAEAPLLAPAPLSAEAKRGFMKARAVGQAIEKLVAPKPKRNGKPEPEVSSDGTIKLNRCELRVLQAIASSYPKPLNRVQVAILSGYRITSSGLANALGVLRRLELIDAPTYEEVTVSDAGSAWLRSTDNAPQKRPKGEALLAYWLKELGKCEREVLLVHVNHYPNTVTKDQVCADTGYSHESSGPPNALGRLRTLGLIEGKPNARANKELIGKRS